MQYTCVDETVQADLKCIELTLYFFLYLRSLSLSVCSHLYEQ